MNVKIKDIPINDRPRERLLTVGTNNISNEELLAILLKTGTVDSSAKTVATNVLKQIGDIHNLQTITLEQLKQINGIGPAKACVILAAVELAKRINTSVDNINNLKINSTDLVYKYYHNILSDKKQEYFYCLYLDNKKKVITNKNLFIGTINGSIVHPREIFKEAVINSASSIICVHNHPSGNVIPSKEDKELTKRIVYLGQVMGIPVIDHIIIGKNKYYSFFENNDI